MNLDLKELGSFYRNQLLNDVVPFWFPRAVDKECGGLLHCFDADGTLVDSDKSVWAQGRMAWMLLTMYNSVEKRPEWLEWAESALQFLIDHCVDTDGRMFFHVTREGAPIRKRRYAYSECFAAIAFAAHAGVTGNKISEERARQFLDTYLKVNFEPGFTPAKFTDVRPMTGLGTRIMTIGALQEIRKYLGEDPMFTQWIDRCLLDLETLFLKPELKAVMEIVNEADGSISDHFDGRTLNPGHAIEGGWFVLEEARYRNNDPRLIKIGCNMIDWMFERGWDKEKGGLLYFVDIYGKPVQEYWHNMKFWWPHDETLIAMVLAYTLTGESRYAEWHNMVKDWSFTHLQDPANGEWYGYLNRDGSPANTLKGSLWKSFYHHPRAMWCCAHYCGAWNNS